MANQTIANNLNNEAALHRSRYEKAEHAYGTLNIGSGASFDANLGDNLLFNLPTKALIYGHFATDQGDSLFIFNGTDLSALASTGWGVNAGTTHVYYSLSYIRGTGRAHPGLAPSTSEVAAEYGVQLNILIHS
jgi:hypothetical protein